jgi:hypothetical protein
MSPSPLAMSTAVSPWLFTAVGEAPNRSTRHRTAVPEPQRAASNNGHVSRRKSWASRSLHDRRRGEVGRVRW